MELDLRDLCFGAYKHLADKLEGELATDGRLLEDVHALVKGAISEVLHTRNKIQVHDGLAAGFRVCHRILEHRRKALENAANTKNV